MSTASGSSLSGDGPPANRTSALSKETSNHLKQKRARSQLSCTPCRNGKLKCNRVQEPACDQCIKRNRESSCIFLPAPVKNNKTSQNVKGRIKQLESLVVGLMNQQNKNTSHTGTDLEAASTRSDTRSAGTSERDGSSTSPELRRPGPSSQPTPPSDSDTSPHIGEDNQSANSPESGVDKPFGQMRISKDGYTYVGDSHWQTILDSISDLKRDLGDDKEGDDDDSAEAPCLPTDTWRENAPMHNSQSHSSTGLGFMLGNYKAVTQDEIVAAVPEKRVADRLLSLWFNSPDPFKPIVHGPTFQDEYKKFWRDPKAAPIMWLGLLFAILSLAESFGLRDVNPDSQQAQECQDRMNKYHSMAAAAAALADFTKPKEYTLECLILYLEGLHSNNAFVNVWLMIGLIVRLALRMGYHRDPSHYPNISAFHGEMRRRVWGLISMIDVLISFQLGLPSMVRTISTDCEPPRNLLDRDFNVSTKVLPASRGINELTPSSYTRAKVRIVRIFAQASELSHATVSPSQEEVTRLDQELEQAKAAVPPLLQMPDMSELVTDPAEQLMCRFNLDLLYLKTKTVLHRRYMLVPMTQLSREEQSAGVGRSRLICVESALRVLQHHQTIHAASQPGGQLDSVKWYMGSLSTHDFLLAAMIICLELSHQIDADTMMRLSGGIGCPHRDGMMEALERSQRIWSGGDMLPSHPWKLGDEDFHNETVKASRAMAVMLERVKARYPPQDPHQNDPSQSNGMHTTKALLTSMGVKSVNGAHTSSLNPAAFNGLFSNYSWPDVPDNFAFQDRSPANPQPALSDPAVSAGVSATQGSSNGFTPNNYSMIGDMLDGPVNLDWQLWDSRMMDNQMMDSQLPIVDNEQYPISIEQAPNQAEQADFPGGWLFRGDWGDAIDYSSTVLPVSSSKSPAAGFNEDLNFDAGHLMDYQNGAWQDASQTWKG